MLRDFAATGRQLLVFTCHEHIVKLFQSLKVPLSRLPHSSEADRVPITFEQPVEQKRKQRKKPDQLAPIAANQPHEEQPADEIAPLAAEAGDSEPERDGVFDADFYDTQAMEDEIDQEEQEEDEEYIEEHNEEDEGLWDDEDELEEADEGVEEEDEEHEEDEYEDDDYEFDEDEYEDDDDDTAEAA
ncbi:MAG: hypothetical protein A2V70_18300 [Planctomycetes bacterium RBG_13_63_9]|nr:MAG: hypothetical protein A2V70_18300 [Planctomycetes bacterium RBG_13_63_9]